MNPLIVPRLPLAKNTPTNRIRSSRNIGTSFTQRISSPRLTSRKIVRSGDIYDEPETLAAEKFQLLSEIKQLQKELAPLYNKIGQYQTKINMNNEEMIKYQEKFVNHNKAIEAQNKIDDEKTLLKLQELFDKCDAQYEYLTSYINVENERKLKSEFVLQKQVLGLLRHEISVIDENQRDVDNELNSDELVQRKLIMEDLLERISSKKAELKEANLLTKQLVDSIQNTIVLKPKTEKELLDEISRLKHQIVTIQKIEGKVVRDRVSSPYKPKQPDTKQTSPRRPIQKTKQQQQTPKQEAIKEPERKIHDEYYYSDYYSEDEEIQKPDTKPKELLNEEPKEERVNSEEKKKSESEDEDDFESDDKSDSIGNDNRNSDEANQKENEPFNDDFVDDFEDDDFVESKSEEEEHINEKDKHEGEDGFDIDLFNITQARTNKE